MNKIFYLLIIYGVFQSNLKAQDTSVSKKQIIYFRVGASLLIPFNQQGNPVIFPALTFVPGIRILEEDNFIVSLSVPISFMGTFKTDLLMGIDFPVMLDFSFGAAAANNNKSTVGFVAGAGMAYIDAVNNYDNIEGYYKRADFWGYRLQLGIDIGKESNGNDRDILFLTYGRSMIDRRNWMIGISFQLMLSKP
jgi:hypothetical protein